MPPTRMRRNAPNWVNAGIATVLLTGLILILMPFFGAEITVGWLRTAAVCIAIGILVISRGVWIHQKTGHEYTVIVTAGVVAALILPCLNL